MSHPQLCRKTKLIIGGPGAGKQVIFEPVEDPKSMLVDVATKIADAQKRGGLTTRQVPNPASATAAKSGVEKSAV